MKKLVAVFVALGFLALPSLPSAPAGDELIPENDAATVHGWPGCFGFGQQSLYASEVEHLFAAGGASLGLRPRECCIICSGITSCGFCVATVCGSCCTG